MTTTVTLSGPEEAFLLSEARRLDQTPEEVLAFMLRCQELARRAVNTPQGRKAQAVAIKSLREQL